MPFEIKNIHAMPDGFEVEFTLPADKKTLQNPMNYDLANFTYMYHHIYGSPVINAGATPLKGIIISDDGTKVRLVMDSLKLGYIHQIKLGAITAADGKSLLHNVGYYTLNYLPEGEKAKLKPNEVVKMSHAMMMGNTKPATATKALSGKRVLKMPADWGKPDQVISLATKPGLKYDKNLMQVKAGAKVKLVFNNNDDMTHNVVITMPGAADDVANMALNLGLKGSQLNYVPATSKVLFHTALLQPNSSESIYFIAPSQPGNYVFVCTYPGHASVMRGVLKVSR
jgi:azurin